MYKTFLVETRITAANDRDAGLLRKENKEKGLFLINLMSSPGSGKTSTLKQLISLLKEEYNIAVLEADIESSVDAATIEKTGARVIQMHTGGMCHVDADMSRQALENMGTEGIDLAVLENVGNLICPAEYDTGAEKSIMILSVPEGDDKPLKYPLMFEQSDLVLINKIDALPYFKFDMEECVKRIMRLNPRVSIIPVSAKTGEGFQLAADWIRRAIREWKAR